MGLLREKFYPSAIGIIAAIIACKFMPPHVEGIKEVIQSIVNSSAIAIGFLATSLSILYSIGKTRVMKDLGKIGYKNHIVNYFIESMAAWFLLFVISGLLLLIDFRKEEIPKWGQYSLVAMFGVMAWSIASLIRIVFLFRKILNSQ